MDGFSQSPFLQALGWATLNSFWQMGLLWCCFLIGNYFFRFSASKKYILATGSIIAGFLWFLVTFFGFLFSEAPYQFPGIPFMATLQSQYLQLLLSSASVTYLLLLALPGYRLFLNWQFIQELRKQELQKPGVQMKLFVKKISRLLGIQRNVGVHFSSLVKSPVTIGYLKPVILLPLAAINNLTLQQVEAILLHELSHIKRYDYLLNLIITIIHTFLYFNPFMRFFTLLAKEERENCCDQLVLQFGYDKISYASALLSLEKYSLRTPVFALGAAGENNLLKRIERIVGLERKPVVRMSHFMSLSLAFLFVLAVNTMFISTKAKKVYPISFHNWVNPFYFFNDPEETTLPPASAYQAKLPRGVAKFSVPAPKPTPVKTPIYPPDAEQAPTPYLNATYVSGRESLSVPEKENVTQTLEAIRKLLETTKWKEIENSIGDALTETEKIQAKQEYLNEVEKIDWSTFEKTLKDNYDKINWADLTDGLKNNLISVQLDSLKENCETLLTQLDRVAKMSTCPTNCQILPFPDESLQQIKERKTQIEKSLIEIKKHRINKVDL